MKNQIMHSLRILYVSDKVDIVGGGEISLLHLISGLQAGGGIKPFLAVPVPGELSSRAELQNIPFVTLPQPRVKFRPWSLTGLWKQGERLIDDICPDIIHVNSTRSMLVAGIAGHRHGIPVVWHVRVEGRDLFDRWLASRCSLIITPSRVVASRYPTADVRVIPNPVQVPPIGTGSANRDRLRSQYLQGDEFLLLAIGELVPRKGHYRVIEALSQLDPTLTWQLLICGRESAGGTGFRQELEDLVAVKGLVERVHLLGFREDVPELMMASDLLIHAPDLEGFGRVFIEAMATGLPLVVSPVGGLKELHEDTGLGWVSEDMTPAALAGKVEAALGDLKKRERFRVEGPAIARERFSIEEHAERVMAVYRELLGVNDLKVGPRE